LGSHLFRNQFKNQFRPKKNANPKNNNSFFFRVFEGILVRWKLGNFNVCKVQKMMQKKKKKQPEKACLKFVLRIIGHQMKPSIEKIARFSPVALQSESN